MGRIDLETLNVLAKNGEIDTVIIAATDTQGRLFGKRCPVGFFLAEGKDGINTCSVNMVWDIEQISSENYGFSSIDTGYQDMHAVPDLATLRLYPWFEKTAFVIADLYATDNTEIQIAPRNILKRQLAKAKAMGVNIQAASELEFYMFKETIDSARGKSYHNLEPLSRTHSDYSIFRTSCDEWFLGALRRSLDKAGLNVLFTKGEYGPGQVELNLQYTEALEMADRTAILKNGVKEIAYLNNMMVTFMAKYDTEQTGSSFHVHLSLWDDNGKNVLWDENDPDKMSPQCKSFLAGIIKLTPDLTCFYAPYINSYKRYGPTPGAPCNLSWGFDNRTISFRVINNNAKGCRIENRIPAADANPYLVLAACIASGLYGIENNLTITDSPTLDNAMEDEKSRKLPASLMEAVKDLEKSELARELFGKEVIDHYLTATNDEINNFLLSVTDWEKRRYFEQI